MEEIRDVIAGASVVAVDSLERDTLFAGTGDSKDNAVQSDIYQVVANMVKTAAELGYAAVLDGVLFKYIVVYGLLVDYKKEETVETCKLTLNFVERTSTLHLCNEPIPLTTSFERVTACLDQQVAIRV